MLTMANGLPDLPTFETGGLAIAARQNCPAGHWTVRRSGSRSAPIAATMSAIEPRVDLEGLNRIAAGDDLAQQLVDAALPQAVQMAR